MADRYSEDPDLIRPLVITHLIPVVGGLYEYSKWSDSNPEISKIFLFGTWGLPIIVLVDRILSTLGLSNYVFSTVILLGFAFLVKKLFLENNRYGDFIWISYTGLIGFIYAYYVKYSEDEGMKFLLYHFAVKTFAYALIIGLILGVLFILAAGVFLNTGVDIAAVTGV